MPRLRNELTGAVMSVSDSTASLLGSEWVAADEQNAEANDAPKKRAGRPTKADSSE